MSSCFNRCGRRARRPLGMPAGCFVLGLAWFAGTGARAFFVPDLHAQQSRTVKDRVYTDQQAARGQAIYKDRCASCHGAGLEGSQAPPLTGDAFVATWAGPIAELFTKIKQTMPADNPGKLTGQQAADIVAYVLQVGKFPAGQAELGPGEGALKQITLLVTPPTALPIAPSASHTPSFPPAGNLAQLMRGILFPSSNLIFNVQGADPGAPLPQRKPGDATYKAAFSWVDWGAGIYTGWELVDYAAVSVAEAAPLLLTPGRRCENGRPVPVDRADWIKFTMDMADAGRAAYKASQSRSQDAVSEATNQLADSCLNCHVVYRDKPAVRPGADPGNKASRCLVP